MLQRLRVSYLFVAVTVLALVAPVGMAQTTAGVYPSGNVATPFSSPAPSTLNLTYRRPSEKIKLRNYVFDAFGPYPIVGSALLGAVSQANKTPPEWGQGFGAYGERVGSDFGIALATTTTRYALAEAFREDTLYYRCECSGILRRMGHAMISTVTARRGRDGHRRLSFPAIVSPYAGTMTAVYGWYPGRYDAKDGLRMGNYALLAFMAGNIAKEFIYGGPHTLFSHLDRPGSPGADSAESTSNH
ncbi:MAG: hypothetical protein WA621_16965 [Candidatus Acidiferrum sp.]|jgi:hypothetical protein